MSLFRHRHKWEQVYISGKLGKIYIKFIGTYCLTCRKGYPEIMDILYKMGDDLKYGTYNEKYFDEKQV